MRHALYRDAPTIVRYQQISSCKIGKNELFNLEMRVPKWMAVGLYAKTTLPGKELVKTGLK